MQQLDALSKSELEVRLDQLKKEYEAFAAKGLRLDMSRGKPSPEQLDLTAPMLDVVNSKTDCKSIDGIDCRNYGDFEGIPECKALFCEMLGVTPAELFIFGNSSLSIMYDVIGKMMLHGVRPNAKPWHGVAGLKFLCPSPGYDRHFSITECFGFEMIPVPMTENGPDMDVVEALAAQDDKVKGIWCVPKYSNPQGITYSDETVRRLANMKTAASDFIIMWDNAYAVHKLYDEDDTLLNILDECKKAGEPDRVIMFTSTSKITYAGAGLGVMACDVSVMNRMRKLLALQTIGFDKMNMLRHARYFKNIDGILAHMEKHANVIRPKFQLILETLEKRLGGKGIARWIDPKGGYFVSLDVMEGTAKRVVSLCKEGGVILTGAGATYPYGHDPKDSNIRIAPSFPSLEDLGLAAELLCICTELTAVEKLLQKA